ncbi:MAG: hypothetical protein IJY52_05735 [Anaerotignum sp.]|nr:hypothetical protein [Anaerotignum sp.]
MSDEKIMVDTEKICTETEKDGVPYIEETVYRVFNDGTKEFACSASYPKPSETEDQLTPAEQKEARETYIMAMME